MYHGLRSGAGPGLTTRPAKGPRGGSLCARTALIGDIIPRGLGIQEIRSDTGGDPSRRVVHGVSRKVSLAGRGLYLVVSQQLADHG